MPRALILIEDGSFPLDRRVRRQAATLTAAGMGVTVICPRYAGERFREIVDGVRVYRYPTLQRASLLGHLLEYAISLSMMMVLSFVVWLREGFDVVQACNPPDLLFLVALPFRALGKPFVFDHHDLCPELFESRFGRRGSPIHRCLLRLERWSVQRADLVISTNETYRRMAIERDGARPERVIVVRNGPDLGRFQIASSDRAEDLPATATLLGYVGNMNEQDGVDHLLRAIAELRTRGREDVGAVLIGDGDSRPALEALAASLDLSRHVRFTGRIPDARLLELLASCDIGVQPDPLNPLNDVSTMNKVMEYMALGKPVVAYDLRETRCSAGSAALYARPNDLADFAAQIERLADDRSLRQRMGDEGRRRVEAQLSWECQSPIYCRAMGDLVGLTDRAPARPPARGERFCPGENLPLGRPGQLAWAERGSALSEASSAPARSSTVTAVP